MVIAELVRKDDKNSGANITVRGVEPTAFALRPKLKIVAGRNFTPGLRELIVGSGVLRQFQGAEIGNVLRMRGSDWTVVGEFESGDAHDSELWTDINVARTTFQRTGSSSVLAALDGPVASGSSRADLPPTRASTSTWCASATTSAVRPSSSVRRSGCSPAS